MKLNEIKDDYFKDLLKKTVTLTLDDFGDLREFQGPPALPTEIARLMTRGRQDDYLYSVKMTHYGYGNNQESITAAHNFMKLDKFIKKLGLQEEKIYSDSFYNESAFRIEYDDVVIYRLKTRDDDFHLYEAFMVHKAHLE